MLISTQPDVASLSKIKAAAHWAKGLGRPLQFDFEHGQWWVANIKTGATWSVVDAYPGIINPFTGRSTGIDFEMIIDSEDHIIRPW